MNILFVRNYPSVDGSFTLLLRLASQFKKDGHMPYYIDFGGKTDFEKDLTEEDKKSELEGMNDFNIRIEHKARMNKNKQDRQCKIT